MCKCRSVSTEQHKNNCTCVHEIIQSVIALTECELFHLLIVSDDCIQSQLQITDHSHTCCNLTDHQTPAPSEAQEKE